ncbi:MAG: hypothetical protein VW799_06215 [Halieaceae bacterium]
MLSTHLVFEVLVACHILTGTVGLLSFWIPIIGRKGGRLHRQAGKLFSNALLLTGLTAMGIASTTLADPSGTHPHLATHAVFSDPDMIAGVFGWMMLYLATLTVNLVWQGRLSLKHRRDHRRAATPFNLFLQFALIVTAANCAAVGLQLHQPMMMAMSLVGFATVGTNLWFIYKPSPKAHDYIKEHIKSLVGAGISVYTAFFAFGAVRLMPEIALTPALWAIPLITGLGLIIYHQGVVTRQFRPRGPALEL